MFSNKSHHRHVRLMLSGAVAAFGALVAATPASAQFACDLNGAPGPDTPSGADTLWCGQLDGFQNTSGQTAVGSSIFIFGEDSTAVGSNSATDEVGATAIGAWSIAAGSVGGLMLPLPDYTQTAVGYHAIAIGPGALAIGDQAAVGVPESSSNFVQFTPLDNGTAVGSHSLVAANNGTALGTMSGVVAANGTALGYNSVVFSENATAVGSQASAFGVSSVAIGRLSATSADGAIALGGDGDGDLIGAAASAEGAIAFGADAQASAVGSVAIGAGSIADQANTVSVGAAGSERKIVNVAAGTAATDAVNVGQLQAVTVDISAIETNVASNTTAIAANTTAIGNLQATQALVEGRIDTLFDLRRSDRRDMKQGVAAAMSMAQAPMPSGPGRISYALNGATFRGEYAIGGSLNYRLNTEAPMMFSVGASFAGNKNNGFRVGVAGEF